MFHSIILLLFQLPLVLFSINQQTNVASTQTWREMVGDVPVWITVMRADDGAPLESSEQLSWWEWGDTVDDSYLFAVGDPNQVKMILRFSAGSDGVPEASFYLNEQGTQAVQYTMDSSTIMVESAGGHAYLRMRPRSGSWVVDEQPNFDLDLYIDGVYRADIGPANAPTDGVTDVAIQVGADADGEPDWQTAQLLHDPAPRNGYRRFEAQWRLEEHPPFVMAEPFMPTFPLFGFGELSESDWLVENPLPIVFSMSQSKLLIDRLVGINHGGIVGVGSVSKPPYVNFEVPFVWHSFDPTTRQSQLVVRGGYSSADGMISAELPPQHLAVRYSWKTDSDTRWKYSLQMSDFHEYDEQLQIGNVKIVAVEPNDFAPWVIEKSWRAVIFVEAMNGYPGSEGIYFYSAESAQDWRWMSGITNDGSGFIEAPYLPDSQELTETSVQSLPRDFRGEYAYALPDKPSLYLSPIDGLLHLFGAQGGIWNLGNQKVLRTSDRTGDGILDTWQVEEILQEVQPVQSPTRALPGNVVESVYDLGSFILHSTPSEITLLSNAQSRSVFTTSPPQDRSTWTAFREQLPASGTSQQFPQTMRSWLDNLSGERMALAGASVNNVRNTAGGFRFELTLAPEFTLTAPDFLGISDLGAGNYLVRHDGARFLVEPLGATQLKLKIEPHKLEAPNLALVTIENQGPTDALAQTLIVEALAPDGSNTALGKHLIDVWAGEKAQLLVDANLQDVSSVEFRLEGAEGQLVAELRHEHLLESADVVSREWLTSRGLLSLPILTGFALVVAFVAQALLSNQRKVRSVQHES